MRLTLDDIAKERWDNDHHDFTSFPADDHDDERCAVAYAAPELLQLLLSYGSTHPGVWDRERKALICWLREEVEGD